MSDAAPWEDYAPAASAAKNNDAAPWEDFAPGTVNPTNGQTYTDYERDLYAQHPELAPGYRGPHGPNLLQQVGGALETGAHLATGIVSPFAGGLTYLGTLGLTFDPDAAKAVQEDTENAVTYQPRTHAGKNATDTISDAASATLGRATDYVSDKAADIGGPLAGAVARTTIEGAPYLIGLGPEMSAARGAVRVASNPAATARDVADAARNALTPRTVTNEGAAAAAAIEGAPKPPRPPKITIDPATIEYDASGMAITPKPKTAAPVMETPAVSAGGRTAAEDAAARGQPLPEFTPPTPEGASREALPLAEHETRSQTLRDVGLSEARESAITGATKEAGTDFQTSKLDNDAGNRMSEVIDNERKALQDYSQQLVDRSGGSNGTTAADLENRGKVIQDAIESLHDHYDAQIKKAYQAADAASQGLPVDMPETAKFLTGERAQFLGTVEGKQLREGVLARMRDLGIMDEEGAVQPATVLQAERLKQYLGDQYSPRTARLIYQMKDAIDNDVTKAAGSDIYKAARAVRAERGTVLEDPTGIKKLAPPEDRLGINRAVPYEKTPDYVINLPGEQFQHVVNTLRSSKLDGSAAFNEIRAHFANRAREAGNNLQSMWNAAGYNKFLRANAAKMAHVFAPEEMAQFRTLNDAGNILRMDRSYPGAAVQGHNLAVRGVLGLAKHAEGLGALAGHGPGYVAGAVVSKGAEKIAAKVARAQVEKRIRKL